MTADSTGLKVSQNLYTEGTDRGAPYTVQRLPKVLESPRKEHEALLVSGIIMHLQHTPSITGVNLRHVLNTFQH